MLLNLLFFTLAVFGFNQEIDVKNNLTLKVENVKSSEGVIRVLLFKNSNGFPDNQELAFQNATIKIDKNKAVHTFTNLPDGTYAISLFHDSQNTGKLRTNILGIPKDGYGFSNNVSGIIGPPSFENAAFKMTQNLKSIIIVLK